jgi:hypothetical protein
LNSRPVYVALLAGLLPIVAAHAAYVVNFQSDAGLLPEYRCMPYVDGCVSVSRAARSGPGLLLFRWLMLPSAFLLLLCWRDVHAWLRGLQAGTTLRRRWIAGLGIAGAVFLVLYVTALGNESGWYNWQRRYGVTVYFGGTALAQLLLVWVLWPLRRNLLAGTLHRPIAWLFGLICLQWVLGVFSSVKRFIFADPEFVDRLENLTEWWFALPMSLAFVAIAWLLARTVGPNSYGDGDGDYPA